MLHPWSFVITVVPIYCMHLISPFNPWSYDISIVPFVVCNHHCTVGPGNHLIVYTCVHSRVITIVRIVAECSCCRHSTLLIIIFILTVNVAILALH